MPSQIKIPLNNKNQLVPPILCSRHDASVEDFDAGRRLLDMGRRRRVVYSGWALVEVEQQKTCAYEWRGMTEEGWRKKRYGLI